METLGESTQPEASAVPPALPLPAAEPSSVADGVERTLDPRSVALERKVGWISAASVALPMLVTVTLLLLLAPILTWVKALMFLGWMVVAGVSATVAHRWPAVAHRHTFYKVDAQGLQIRRGVFWRVVINVPRSRVQHTDVAQGPLERTHGLGTLVVYTAGTDHAKVSLHGLDHGTAMSIRDHLLPGDARDAV